MTKEQLERTIKEMEEKIKDWSGAVEFLKLHLSKLKEGENERKI